LPSLPHTTASPSIVIERTGSERSASTMRGYACKLGLEGIVSKRRDLPYRYGRCRSWVKVKNPASPAVLRIQDGTW
jgi:ATP-dependent DNA ligase